MITNKNGLKTGRRGREFAAVGVLLAIAYLLSLLFVPPSLQAQTFTVLHAFTGKGDGESPGTGVTLSPKGNLYGTTGSGGAFQRGTVFEINAQGKESILYSFWGGEGLQPSGPAMRDHAGTFYGVTVEGGTPEGGGCIYGCGAVFKLDKSGKESVLNAFTGKADGAWPWGSLARDEAGNLYGITEEGGQGCGVVYKVDTHGKETVLYAFTENSDGCERASGGLILDNAGNLYGPAYTFEGGFVYRLSPAGQMTVLYKFTGGTDGGWPGGPLLRDAAGNLYGEAGGGNPSCNGGGCGVVYKLDTAGKESVLYSFQGSPDGADPGGGLVRDKAGRFYGTTEVGGLNECTEYGTDGCGTIFELDSNGNETVLHSFTGGLDGDNPWSGLALDGSGNLYGTTPYGGDSSCDQGYGCGVVFKLVP